MPSAVERIVVQTTPREKRAIAAKARRLSLTLSELMRRGAFAYRPAANDAELATLADAARGAAVRSAGAIDKVLSFISASNRRIAALEASAGGKSRRKAT